MHVFVWMHRIYYFVNIGIDVCVCECVIDVDVWDRYVIVSMCNVYGMHACVCANVCNASLRQCWDRWMCL